MSLLDLAFPKRCLSCNKNGVYICESCIKKVKRARLICPVCQKPSIDGFTHAKCKRKYGIDGLVALWEYKGVVRKAIISLKYRYALDIVDELANFALGALKDMDSGLPGKDCGLIPVPMHWYRENTRGFNQSFNLGKKMSQNLGWKFTSDILVRRKLTRPQVQLKGDQRRKNIRGVFSLITNYHFSNNNYVLFDDVYTTGSTMREAAKVLKRAGAMKVWGLTMAR
jgi:competence protein ComFC